VSTSRRALLLWVAIALSALAVLLVLSRLPGRSLIQEGAEAWERGDLVEARAAWEEAASSPFASGILLYDLGNVYYREGDLPRALACWRAARGQRPRDPALVHNIALARSHLEGVPEPVGVPVGWMALVTPGEVGLLATALLIGFSVSARRWWHGRGQATPWLVLGTCGALLGGAALHGGAQAHLHPVGVIVDGPAVARDAATPEGRERFTLQPGAEVRVARSLGAFVLVDTGDGRRGWVPAPAVYTPGREVFPPPGSTG